MILFQVILALLVASLEFGPLGQHGLKAGIVSFSLVATWAFTWFVDQKTGLRWAVLMGIIYDLASFLPFGTWLVTFVVSCFVIDLLKSRFFEVSSLTLALATLAGVSLVSSLILGAVASSFDLFVIAGNLIATVVTGLIIYYILAIRFRFWQRWTGKRL